MLHNRKENQLKGYAKIAYKSEYNKEYNNKNKDEAKKYNSYYYESNKDKISAYKKLSRLEKKRRAFKYIVFSVITYITKE